MQKCYKCGLLSEISAKPLSGRNIYICKPCNSVRMKIYYDGARRKILKHYGNICNCCGESEEKFLTIDHINNDVGFDRYTNGKRIGGRNLYVKIVSSGFPETYQLLCMNCNFGKRMNNGICPHNSI